MSKKLFVLAYLNEQNGWQLTEEAILAYNELPGRTRIVLDRGRHGCPLFEVRDRELVDFMDGVEDVQEKQAVAVAIFTQIPGVTAEIEQAFYDAKIYNFADLRGVVALDPDKLLEIKGLGPAKLQKIKDYLKEG